VISSSKVVIAKNHTLYAHWTGIESKVTFNANGGSVSTVSKNVNYKSTYGTLPTPTFTGYTFNGWYTKSSGGKKITASTTVSITSAQTLYAHWLVNTYEIVFDGNGNVTGNMNSLTVNCHQEITLPQNAYSWGDNCFLGWSTKKTGAAMYQDQETVINLSVSNHATVTLYAVWSNKTSDKSIYSEYYQTFVNNGWTYGSKKKKFTSIVDILDKEKSYIIPGLAYSNTGQGILNDSMIPQGVCTAGEYLLISAYEEDGVYDSVIYVKDKETDQYLVTIELGTKCHVGALAYDPIEEVVYIADSSSKRVLILSMSKIKEAVETGRDVVSFSVSKDMKYQSVSINPSFLTYYDGKLFVGNFDKTVTANNHMIAYTVENGSYTKTEIDISLPLKCQGVAFTEYADAIYMICSASYGRTNQSKLYIYKMAKTNEENWIEFQTVTNAAGELEKVGLDGLTAPNMSEDIDCAGEDVLNTCYESAANTYQYSTGTSKRLLNVGTERYPIDRITISSVSKLISLITNDIKSEETTPEESNDSNGITAMQVVDSGECGENVTYKLYDNGILNISGEGTMDDYTDQAAPWDDSLDQITQVSVGAKVASIGAQAFAGAENLEKVTVSDISDTDQKLTIGESAFASCESLTQVSLPDKKIIFQEDALPADNEELEISSDSKSVAAYCKESDISLHTHEYQYIRTIKPTCGSYGYDIYECECGEIEYRNCKDMTGYHDFEVLEKIEPGNDILGSVSYQCKKCGAYYAEDIEP
jgi:uncharacterized repeat protein (TIGR02543 family)